MIEELQKAYPPPDRQGFTHLHDRPVRGRQVHHRQASSTPSSWSAATGR
ncbi:MAG: hypothetical protein MZV70_50925 [Desulfobacterales bacterium]|nr:hypothetical protein [Desulfobacterales bacterium]